MGKNLSRAPYGTPDWSRYSEKQTSDWLIKKAGQIVGKLENYDFRACYIKREYMWFIIILVWNNVPPLKTGIITPLCKIENFRTHSATSEIALQFPPPLRSNQH
jgi:hypothetical protein